MNFATIGVRNWDQSTEKRQTPQAFATFKAPALAPPPPPEEDETVLIRSRFLQRGRYCLLAGASNQGKSVFAYYAAMLWAKGLPCLGLSPRSPLRTLFLQCEMSVHKTDQIVWDLAKSIQEDHGTSDWAMEEMIIAKLAMPLADSELLTVLDSTISQYPVDLVFIDPLFGATSLDMKEQVQAAKFLRHEFPKLLLSHNIGGILVHHTRKDTSNLPLDSADFVMRDLVNGSSDLVNAAQSGLMLRPVPGHFGLMQLHAMKEGNELGWRADSGQLAHVKYVATGLYDLEPGDPLKYSYREADPVEVQRVEASVGVYAAKEKAFTAHNPVYDDLATYQGTVCLILKEMGESPHDCLVDRLREVHPKLDSIDAGLVLDQHLPDHVHFRMAHDIKYYRFEEV